MRVFKFGGASVSTNDRILNVAGIIKAEGTENLVVVISAIGKTTNALEKVAEAFYANQREVSKSLFENIRQEHISFVHALYDTEDARSHAVDQLSSFFTEAEWMLHDQPVKKYDYYYDQIVCLGELLSTRLISDYFNSVGLGNEWIDVRDIIRTDNNFRDATIDWQVTAENVTLTLNPLLTKKKLIITQGFIGATDENESTTLGREGSDYTAAVFANLLNAESQTIWKDVPGVMNADPKQYTNAEWLPALNYNEVIEMAYYGAQVIHPKTIKPLRNKNIPLYVRSFLQPSTSGTLISNQQPETLPPVIVFKQKQVLIEFSSKDFSFVSEGLTTVLLEIFASVKFRPNLTQIAAISLLCVVDAQEEKIEELLQRLKEIFEVKITTGLRLVTIRHYNPGIISELLSGEKKLLQQQTRETIQVLVENPAG